MKSVYDDCTYCGGQVQERLVVKPCWWGERLIALVENVPTGVCDQCGEHYYRAEVLKRVDEVLQDRGAFRKIEVPLAEYAPAA